VVVSHEESIMKRNRLFYFYLAIGFLFVAVGLIFRATENANLTPVFVSIGCALIVISLAMIRKQKQRNKTDS
jgi:hypothetical protein